MATSAGEVEVKLTLNADDFRKALGQGSTDLTSFNSVLKGLATTLAATFSFGAIAGFFKSSIEAYAENQLAVTRLTAALNNQGIASDKLLKHLTGMATELQTLTGVQDEAIINAQTLLTTFGIQGETLDRVTKATLDLSAATGIDLQRAALLLGKAYEGQTSSLSRYGVVVNQHIPLQERFAAVMDQVNFRFGGAAAAQAETYTGRLNIMKASFNDLQEQIGAFLAGPAGGFMTWLQHTITLESSSLKSITEASAALGGFGNVLKVVGIELLRMVVDAMTSIMQLMINMIPRLPLIGTQIDRLKQHVSDLNKTINDEINKWQQSTQVAMEASKKKVEAVSLQTKQIVEIAVIGDGLINQSMKDRLAEETKLRSKHAEEAKAAHIEFIEGFVTRESDMWKEATDLASTFTKGVGDGFAKMVIEGKNFTDSMKDLFKNMAEQMISYVIQIIAKLLVLLALESATGTGPAGGSFMRAFATGGMITEPSVMVGLRTGSRTIVGEQGPEMVSPMNGGTQGGSADMGSGGGGSNSPSITINISGQFVEGDQNSWNRLLREKIIPQIRRFTMSSPTGPFNRTRGVV